MASDSISRRQQQVKLLALAGACGSSLIYVGGLLMKRAMERMYTSIKLLPPSETQLQQEDHMANPLFRLIPGLRSKFAWRQLGDFPTPVHRFELNDLESLEFWVKREDLSGRDYGGNKVRSLQFPMASCEVRADEQRKRGEEQKFIALGSGGSNMVIASKLYAAKVGLPAADVTGVCVKDPVEMDNTLNYMSALSMPGQQAVFDKGGWQLLKAIWQQGSAKASWLFAPGGNCPGGVLGQVGGVLELAEQIAKGEVPDPDHIVLPMGSLCTTTGIVVGVALARQLGIDAFKRPDFCVLGVPIHPGLMIFDILFSLRGEKTPLFIGRGIHEVNELIVAGGGPDVKEAAFEVMREQLEISWDLLLCGSYGVHSSASLRAKETYDASVKGPEGAPPLWLCGHFSAKAFAVFLRKIRSKSYHGRRFLIWQTKSAVQPLGPKNEWAEFQEQKKQNRYLGKWAKVDGVSGHPTANKPEAKPRLMAGAEDYRCYMRPVLREPGRA